MVKYAFCSQLILLLLANVQGGHKVLFLFIMGNFLPIEKQVYQWMSQPVNNLSFAIKTTISKIYCIITLQAYMLRNSAS